MSVFKFELSQRVMVPGHDNVQAVVSGRTEFVTNESIYHLRWLTEGLDIQEKMFGETELLTAQAMGWPEVVRAESVDSVKKASGWIKVSFVAAPKSGKKRKGSKRAKVDPGFAALARMIRKDSANRKRSQKRGRRR